MWTLRFRGAFIHGYCDREVVRVQTGDELVWFRSLRAAKAYLRQLPRTP
jgi:hypothetical protein